VCASGRGCLDFGIGGRRHRRRPCTVSRSKRPHDPPPEEGFDRALFTPDRWVEVEDAMWEIYATGITHKPSFINAIFEEAYGLAQAETQH
jgi:hypothetical protein